jgi:hypothetical protein
MMKIKRTPEWAIAEMSAWLASPLEFGQAPVETEVWMHKALPWLDGNEHDCFLVRFKMADGYESVGFTGPVTWAFFELPMAEIERLRKSTRLRDLIDLYAGWCLAFATVQQDPKSTEHDPAELQARIAHLQRRTERQIPVNLTFKEYLKVGKETLWVLEGDLLYNEKSTVLPPEGELSGIEVASVFDKKKAPYMGELGLYFYLWKSKTKGFGRGSRTEALTGLFPIYCFVGRTFGPYRRG